METKKRGELVVSLLLIVIIVATSFITYAQQDYEVSPERISKHLKIEKFLDVPITIKNNGGQTMSLAFEIEGDIKGHARIDQKSINVDPTSESTNTLRIYADSYGDFPGKVKITGSITYDIPVNLTVSEQGGDLVEALMIDIVPRMSRVQIGKVFQYKIDINNLINEDIEVILHYTIDRIYQENTYHYDKPFFQAVETVQVNSSASLLKEFEIPRFIKPGDFVINVRAEYLGLEALSSERFFVVEPFMDYLIFGVLPMKWFITIISVVVLGGGSFFAYREVQNKKRRYKSILDYATLPKPGPRSIFIGKIAETNRNAYFDLEQLTTHTLVAGSTGGGKTVSAEVLVEEALNRGVAIIVFDPTAQWTGFLRKNTSKKMFELYPGFGMKKSEAKAFNGNVKQILDARELIDIKKFIKPGELTSFAINRLDPKDTDILVANTIRSVFKANLPESPQLKTIIIFDEVHRLLPKFGGSGQGFLQIERGAREFRKWGVGLILISQVLTDFVGETKANISTEIQMRTRDEGDLNRIKTKYGGYMLQSLLKAATGTGMIENPAYNRGNPYFVAFRPLLHEHARLSDEELENYNKYNNMVDDMDYEIEQLGELGIDVFDLKLELKMALDKVKAGSFNMVNIYIDGLKPRLKSQWDKIGKKPKKREVKLVSDEDLKRDFEAAKAARAAFMSATQGGEAPKGGLGGGNADGSASAPIMQNNPKTPLKLENGLEMHNKMELVDNINTMNDADFASYISEDKNVFADWVKEADPALEKALRKAKTKDEIIALLEDGAPPEAEEEKKE